MFVQPCFSIQFWKSIIFFYYFLIFSYVPYYFLVYVFLLVWWWLENKKGSGCATVLEYGDEIRDAVLMAFGENVTRISLAATTAKKYSQKKRGKYS